MKVFILHFMDSICFGDNRIIIDVKNRLVSVTGTNLSAQFTYNGDGQRVKSVINNETTLFIGGHYEVLNPGNGQTGTKYYMVSASLQDWRGEEPVKKWKQPPNLCYNAAHANHLRQQQ